MNFFIVKISHAFKRGQNLAYDYFAQALDFYCILYTPIS